MNKVENTLLEKGTRNITGTLQVERHKKKGCNGQEVHASTPVETRCTRNDKNNYDNTPVGNGWNRI